MARDDVAPEDADVAKMAQGTGEQQPSRTKHQPVQKPNTVQPPQQSGESTAPPEVTPRMERKLTGSVKLESTFATMYTAHRKKRWMLHLVPNTKGQ